MHEYIYLRSNLICVILLIDAKVGFTNDDILLLNMLHDAKREVLVIASKTDKTNQSMRCKFLKSAKELLMDNEYNNLIMYSSLDNRSLDSVVNKILSLYNS